VRGTVAGLLATAVMGASQEQLIPLFTRIAGRLIGKGEKQQGGEGSSPSEQVNAVTPCRELDDLSSPAKVACQAANLVGLELNRAEAVKWGNRVHWVYGTLWGVAYNLFCARSSWRMGLAFGAGLWLAGDELLLWALGITKPPSAYPLSSHAKALSVHLAYCFAVGTTVRGLCD